jgi:hypothetical protein
MAQSQHVNRNWTASDDEVRESIRVIRREQTTKVVVAVAAIVAAIMAAFVFTYLAYTDKFDAQKTPVTAPVP